MIYESYPWKRFLCRQSEILCRRKLQRRWSESSLACVERELFVSAYAVRKLLDSRKLSDELESTQVGVTRHSWNGRVVDFMSRHDLDECYDLEVGRPVEIGIRTVCNQIVHSFVFVFSFGDDNGLDGFYVASDRSKHTCVYHVAIDEMIRMLDFVMVDEICAARWERNETSGELKVVNKRRMPPEDILTGELERNALSRLGFG